MTGRATKDQPYPLLCNTYIPELYNDKNYKSITLERPTTLNMRESKDAICASISPGSFDARYSYDKNYQQNGTIGTYDYKICENVGIKDKNGLCPQAHGTNGVFCPCVSTTSNINCYSLLCPSVPTIPLVDGCIPFYAKAIGSCYCLKNIQSVISTDGFQGVYSLLSDKANVCRAFTFDYVIAEGLIYAIVIFSTFLNMFLKSSLVYLTQYESHTSVDKLQGSLLLKFFLAVYLNMTFTALIAYGNIPNLPKILVDTYIFQGYVILNFNFKFDINLFHFFLFLTVYFELFSLFVVLFRIVLHTKFNDLSFLLFLVVSLFYCNVFHIFFWRNELFFQVTSSTLFCFQFLFLFLTFFVFLNTTVNLRISIHNGFHQLECIS